MSYYIAKETQLQFEEAIEKVTEELSKEGFGVLTEIDVKETLKKKLDVNFRKYKILGACNPTIAHKALSSEDKIGVMLPCNIVVQEKESNYVEISAINPAVAMKSIENDQMEEFAELVTSKLKKVLNNI